MKKIIFILLLNTLYITSVSATEVIYNDKNYSSLTDGKTSTCLEVDNKSIQINSDSNIYGLYLKWEDYPSSGITVTHGDHKVEHNTGYFQDYIELKSNELNADLNINSKGKLCEVEVVTTEAEKENIHVWEAPHDKADFLFLPTHADDEILFFGGALATYANMENVTIQVAYLVNHANTPYRQQELLNGLWESGIRNYPIIPEFYDYKSSSLDHAKGLYDLEEMLDYQKGLIERFKPQVVVGHDVNGEYGHGVHMLNTHLLLQAIKETEYTPKKLYLHLYDLNPIILDVDTPLENFGGLTAFEVATNSFAHHASQSIYYEVKKSSWYDIRKFGLAHSTVGIDMGHDMLENITTYYDQDNAVILDEDDLNILFPSSEKDLSSYYPYLIVIGSLIVLLIICIILNRKKRN